VGGILFLVFYSLYVGTVCRGLMKYVRPLLFSQGGNISTAPTYSNNLISYFDKSVLACKPKTRSQYPCLLTTLKSPVSTCASHRHTDLSRAEDSRIADSKYSFLLRHRVFRYSFIPQSALRQVHNHFQSQFSTESNLLLPFSRFNNLSFT